MNLEAYIQNFSLEEILEIESQDDQLKALEKARLSINKNNVASDIDKNIFLFLILQNSLVSYQISGSGKLRWEEFGAKISKDFNIIKKLLKDGGDNIQWRYDFLLRSTYNKRIYNIKRQRLVKFDKIREELSFLDKEFSFLTHYNNMETLLDLVSKTMKQELDSKTSVFAIKMFGYGARTVYQKFIMYPSNINIPLDSRIQKIYQMNFPNELNENKKINNKNIDDKKIKLYFLNLSQKNNISPLHLDSLLRLDYWTNYVK